MNPVCALALGYVDLAANDRLDSGSLARLIEINDSVHYSVVCDGHCILSQFFDPLDQLTDTAGAIQQGVFRMHVKVCKGHLLSPFCVPLTDASQLFNPSGRLAFPLLRKLGQMGLR